MPDSLLSVRKLRISHGRPRDLQRGRGTLAVEEVSFDLAPGECLGLVGESGCGKSSLARALCGLDVPQAGSFYLDGQDMTRRPERAWRQRRAMVQMIFQDPAASLDPHLPVRALLAEPLRALHPQLSRAERHERIARVLDQVGLDASCADRRAHEFSGGQAQRIAIARALIVEPRLLICDEPVSSLDVSIQAQIINLLRELQRSRGLSMLFIAHDLSVVRHLCQRVLVMYLGRIVEQGPAEQVLGAPAHPYTRALLSCVPRPEGAADSPILLEGELPDPDNRPSGCVFRTRCPMVDDICAQRVPDWHRQPHGGYSACHFAAHHGSPMVARTTR